MQNSKCSHDDDTSQEFRGIRKNDQLDMAGVDKYASFIVLKKKSFLGYVYFLERRDQTDTLGGKLALFGGSRSDTNPETSHESILDRELGEELGLKGNAGSYVSRSYLIAKRENGEDMAVEIFALEHSISSRLRIKKLRAAQKKQSNNAGDDLVGEVVKIRRVGLNWWWFRGWHNLTPTAAFALLDDWRAEVKARERLR